MTQRKCGTCRHFEAGGIAASGWCRHPDRQDLQHMVLVRKSELACRNGWDEDLWEPRETADRMSGATVRTMHQDQLAATTRDRKQDTDRVTTVGIAGVGRPIMAAQSSSSNSPERATRTVDARNQSNQQYAAEQSDARRERQRAIAEESERAHQQAMNELRSRQESEMRPRSAHEPEYPVQGQVSSPSSNRVSPAAPRMSPLRQDGPDIDAPPRTPAPGRSWPGSPISQPERTGREPGLRTKNGFGSHSPSFGSSDYREPRRPREQTAPGLESQHISETNPHRSGSTEQFQLATDVSRAQLDSEHLPQPVQADELIESPPNVPVAHGSISQIPRCCATCRDFRPSEGGERGWCNNNYAFDHRQMVHKDDIACSSSIGDWWTPNDDWWLQRADISHHGRPTPRVDEYIQQVLAARGAQKRRQAQS